MLLLAVSRLSRGLDGLGASIDLRLTSRLFLARSTSDFFSPPVDDPNGVA
jgi:hypothetical protein